MAPGVYASPRPRTPPSHGTAVEVQPRPAGWKGGEQLDFLVVKNHGESVFSLKTNEPMEFPNDIDILGGYVSVFFGIFTPIVGEMIPF